ncbi:hypothetical protein AJ80_07233 [Polytolypa hystricis UAMH7299]|uniref:Mediator of RNA polymerase II transcription subunit 14 n=1 Tax=Polytolypa hystricis (strain UAMH7299) TaxID=1447883 RepID=A0A2B7XRK1_POLH7|nr:hypothetical protein AJ80_07233 [Polytolypa hystricis UAMH7299]
MPGIIMDDVRSGIGRAPLENGTQTYHDRMLDASLPENAETNSHLRKNGVNETAFSDYGNPSTAMPSTLAPLPPELVHISEGFFPFAQLINRAVQQCWNDLTELITELADVKLASVNGTSPSAQLNTAMNGKARSENAQKRLRLLEMLQMRRAEFIKLLVLSQWGRRATDVSKLIDLQAFIRMRYDMYNGATLYVGEMKRDLIRAQMGNPDLRTAFEVITTGRLGSMQHLGFISPGKLTSQKMLKTIRSIDKLIKSRLILHDSVPLAFANYTVRNGRVTFVVQAEFEIDLSIAHEDPRSQFFFVDLRFLFQPAPSVTDGRLFDELDHRVNTALMDRGLPGCFVLLHNLALTNKITILFKQAIQLARGQWINSLRVELLRRTLVVQYWANKPGPKSWVEIGINSGFRVQDSMIPNTSFLSLRWVRDNKEVDAQGINFDLQNLSMESLLRSVISLHISHTLRSAYAKLCETRLYGDGTLHIGLQMSSIEPADCCLEMQLTMGRRLKMTLESFTGAAVYQTVPLLLNRQDTEYNMDRSPLEEVTSRIYRLRSAAVMEEFDAHIKCLGWKTVNPRGVRTEDLRRAFPPRVIRFMVVRCVDWRRDWVAAQTSGPDGDNLWAIHLREIGDVAKHDGQPRYTGHFALQSVYMLTDRFPAAIQGSIRSSTARLEYSLSGMICILANARYLSALGLLQQVSGSGKLVLDDLLGVPSLSFRFRSRSLPVGLQIAPLPADGKAPCIKETILLSFKGIDPRSRYVTVIARGQLASPIKNISHLAAKMEPLVAFPPKSREFVMLFSAPAGEPIILPLLYRLQKLEHVLFMAQLLDPKDFRLQSISLSRLRFIYSTEEYSRGDIKFNYRKRTLKSDIECSELLSTTTPLSSLRMSIDFHPRNPQRLIKDSLTAALNGPTLGTSFSNVMALLTATLPLLRSLKDISTGELFKSRVLVTPRSAKVYYLRYPPYRNRFQIGLSHRRGRMVWILRDVPAASARVSQARETLGSDLRQNIYSSKGDGWVGLETGAIADAEKVGNLLLALDGIMKRHLVTLPSSGSAGHRMRPAGGTEIRPPRTTTNESQKDHFDPKAARVNSPGQERSTEKPSMGLRTTDIHRSNIPPKSPATNKKPEVIMID